MKNLVLIVTILLSNLIYSESYESAQRFDSGDVMSAEVLNDILDRIELSLKEVTVSELIGTWDATQYFCDGSNNDPSIDLGSENWTCIGSQGAFSDVSSPDGGFYAKRTDTVTIAAVNDSSTKFTFTSENLNLIYNDTRSKEAKYFNSSQTHTCTIIGGIAMMGCQLDEVWNEGTRALGAYMNIQRLSPTRIKLFFGPWRGGGLFNTVILDKKNLAPSTPTSLQVTPSSSATVSSWEANTTYALNDEIKSDTNVYTVTTEGISGSLAPIHTSGAEENGSATLTFKESVTTGSAASVTLSWAAGDNTDVNFDIKRKDSSEGTFTSLGTTTESSYVDTTVVTGKTYWFRIFAINENGTSLGSNVIKITL